MKKEFWAEFDLYGKVAPYGTQISKLLWEERKKRRIKEMREQLQATVQESIRSFLLQGKLDSIIIPDDASRQMLLSQLLPADVICEGRSTQCKDYVKGKNGLQQWYYGGDIQNPKGNFQEFLSRRMRWMASILNFDVGENVVHPSLPDLSIFPSGSWAIQINFTLRKPYISRDDTDFYIIDNPVKKEWVFKVPYVAPSQWKGALRAAMVRELVMRLLERKIDEEKFFEERIRLYRLFGNEKDGTAEFLNQALARFRVETLSRDAEDEPKKQWEQRVKQEIRKVAEQFESKLREKGYRVGDIEGFQGYLHFYPTFFDKIGLEVINTHDRETGASVKGPIYFECVPAGTKGTFTLLYVPMKEIDEDSSKKDMEEVAKGLKAMLSEYGFGAKTSSGYGVADDKVDGRLIARFSNVSTTAVQPPAVDIIPIVEPKKDFLKYMNDAGEVKPEFQGSGGGGLMSNSEYKKHGKESGGSLSEFKKFRSWYLKYGKTWRESRHSQVTDQSENLNIFHRKLGSLTELIELANLIQSKEPDLNDGEGKNG